MNHQRFEKQLCSAAGLLAVIAAPYTALADVQACVDAHSNGQLRRDDADFLAAQELFTTCSDAACPEPIRVECNEFLKKLAASTPTVLLTAEDAHGADVLDVAVRLDDKPFLESLTGRAVPVNPGSHKFQFVRPDGTSTELRVLILEGVKGRKIVGQFQGATDAGNAKPSDAQVPLDVATSRETKTNNRTLAYVLAGGGVAALGAFTFFALSGRSRLNDLRNSCSPNCTDSQASTVSTKYLLADLSLLAAAGFFGASAYVYFSVPSEPRSGFNVGFARAF